jgi:hypothetical protein
VRLLPVTGAMAAIAAVAAAIAARRRAAVNHPAAMVQVHTHASMISSGRAVQLKTGATRQMRSGSGSGSSTPWRYAQLKHGGLCLPHHHHVCAGNASR